MPTAEEFYRNADEHFEWADTAKTERERAIFLQMAAAWLAVARGWDDGTPVSAAGGTWAADDVTA